MKSNIANAGIGVFDSGVGGLTVLRAIHQQFPSEQLLYVADSTHAPYGERETGYIADRCLAIAQFLQQQPVKALVVACNTASVVALSRLRDTFQLPIIGIEPAIKPAASVTRSGVVGVLATSQTMQSHSVKRLCELYGQDVDIILQPCPGLVDHIERAELKSQHTTRLLQEYLTPLIDKGADTIVLGCTHYPFVSDAIKEIVGSNVTVIEPGTSVARQLGRRLDELNLRTISSTGTSDQRVTFYSTGNAEDTATIISSLWGHAVSVHPIQNV